MKTKIRWTSVEEELVLNRALEVMHINRLGPYDALRHSQIVLPEIVVDHLTVIHPVPT